MDALMSNFAGHFEHQVAAADESPAASSSDDDGGGGDDAAQLSEGEAASQELIRRMMQDEATAAVTTSRPRRERKQVQSYTDTDALEPTAPRPREAARKRRGGGARAAAAAARKRRYSSDDDSDSSSEDSAPARQQRNQRRRNALPSRSTSRRADSVNYNEDSESDDDDLAFEREKQMKKRVAAAAVDNPDIALSQGDTIERVLHHQYWENDEDNVPNCSTEGRRAAEILGCEVAPHLDGHLKFLVKWKGWSHCHNTWGSRASFAEFTNGGKAVQRYWRKWQESQQEYVMLPAEEQEAIDLSRAMELELLETHSNVERICAVRDALRPDAGDLEYLTKWEGLPYDQATWEGVDDLTHLWKDHINAFEARQERLRVRVRNSAFANRQQRGQEWRKMETQPPWLRNGHLREYQLEGINWLYYQWCKDINTILADEMGLGKTLQTVAFLSVLHYERDIRGPFLLVVPLITVDAWRREVLKWTPEIDAIVYVGNKTARQRIQEYEFYQAGKTGVRTKRPAFNILITTYEMLVMDKNVLHQFNWEFLAVDEAHRLRNLNSKLFEALSDFNCANRLLITGTPLQNNMQELWALLHFLMPTQFADVDDFTERFSNLGEEGAVTELHTLLKPHLLRREKKDAEKDLPPKSYRVVRVINSPMQKKYYKWILNKNFMELCRGVKGKKPSLLNIVTELKKVCNHPYLFESSGYQGSVIDMSPRSMAAAKHNARQRVYDLVHNSGKMIFLDKILTQLKETNHRVLIFSQMVRVLNLLEDYLKLKGMPYQRIDGSTPKQKRFQAMDHFNAPDSRDFVFLLSTRAGGLGINLATADTVIIYDSDWNPQNDLQAESRAHRIGQKAPVIVYRLVTKQSVEENILERAKRKLVMSEAVISGMDTSSALQTGASKATQFSSGELNSILQFGASELFKEDLDEDNAAAAEKIASAMDLDALLERPSHDSAKNDEDLTSMASGQSGLLGAFNVTDFDEGFWEKTIPQAEQQKAEEEETEKQRGEVLSGARATRKAVNYAHDGTNHTDDADTDPFEDGEWGASSKKDKSEDQAPYVQCLNEKECKSFIKAFKKFAMSERIEDILREAGLVVGDEGRAELVKLADALVKACKQKAALLAASPTPVATDSSAASQAAKNKWVQFCGLKVNVAELLMRRKDMQFLAKQHSRLVTDASKIDEYGAFRLTTEVVLKSKSLELVHWTPMDDSMLLLGTHKYGWSSFDACRLDERLNLQDKIPPDSSKDLVASSRLPKKELLLKRVQSLLKAMKGEMKAAKRRAVASGSSQHVTSGSQSTTDHSMKIPLKKRPPPALAHPSKKERTSTQHAASSKQLSPARRQRELLRPCHDALQTLVDVLNAPPPQDKDTIKRQKKDRKKSLLKIGETIQTCAHRQSEFSEEELFVAAHRQMNKYSNDRSKKSLAFDAAKLQQLYGRLAQKEHAQGPK